jgi:hypothetical protein
VNKPLVPPGYVRKLGAARFCGVSQRTISSWQAKRLIPFVKISHRICLFKLTDLEKALDRMKTRAISG